MVGGALSTSMSESSSMTMGEAGDMPGPLSGGGRQKSGLRFCARLARISAAIRFSLSSPNLLDGFVIIVFFEGGLRPSPAGEAIDSGRHVTGIRVSHSNKTIGDDEIAATISAPNRIVAHTQVRRSDI